MLTSAASPLPLPAISTRAAMSLSEGNNAIQTIDLADDHRWCSSAPRTFFGHPLPKLEAVGHRLQLDHLSKQPFQRLVIDKRWQCTITLTSGASGAPGTAGDVTSAAEDQ